jgi:hypothetical protein
MYGSCLKNSNCPAAAGRRVMPEAAIQNKKGRLLWGVYRLSPIHASNKNDYPNNLRYTAPHSHSKSE